MKLSAALSLAISVSALLVAIGPGTTTRAQVQDAAPPPADSAITGGLRGEVPPARPTIPRPAAIEDPRQPSEQALQPTVTAGVTQTSTQIVAAPTDPTAKIAFDVLQK